MGERLVVFVCKTERLNAAIISLPQQRACLLWLQFTAVHIVPPRELTPTWTRVSPVRGSPVWRQRHGQVVRHTRCPDITAYDRIAVYTLSAGYKQLDDIHIAACSES